MMIEDTTIIAAPIARVWELTLDVESWPEHTPTMTSVERIDSQPLAVGSQVRIKQPGQGSKVWTVTELDPHRVFAWSTRTMGTTMTGTHRLAASADGTTQTLQVTIEGPLSRLVGMLLGRPIGKAIATENQGFKEAAERSVNESSHPGEEVSEG